MQGIDGYPEIIAVTKLPHETVNFGGIWHSDTVYLERPPMATMLIAREVPPSGGDTMFASMYAAYDALSPGMQRVLGGLRAVNSSALADVSKTREDRIRDGGGDDATEYVAEHPVVRTHPETGRKALYVNVAHTARFVGMTEEESRPLLQYLFEHSVRPEFTCRFQLAASGSIALWDNRCAMHNPINDYHGYTRTDAPHHARGRRAGLTWDAARAQRGHVADDSRDGAGRARAAFGDADAVVDGDRRIELRRRCRGRSPTRRARSSRCGVAPGERVAVWAPNSLEWIVAALGVTTAGAVLVPVNTRFRGAEAAYILARSNARVLFTVRGFLDTDYPALLADAGVELPALAHTVLLAGRAPDDGDELGWDDVPRTRDTRCPAQSVDARVAALGPDDPSDVVFTSGTTGSPKGVVMTHGQTLRAYLDWCDWAGPAHRRPLPDRQPVLPHLRVQGRLPRVR